MKKTFLPQGIDSQRVSEFAQKMRSKLPNERFLSRFGNKLPDIRPEVPPRAENMLDSLEAGYRDAAEQAQIQTRRARRFVRQHKRSSFLVGAAVATGLAALASWVFTRRAQHADLEELQNEMRGQD